MRIKVIAFTIALLALNAFKSSHPLKMSFSNLSISQDGLVEIETRIFLDDITEHMQKIYGLQLVDFSTITSDNSQKLSSYLTQQFYFKQNDKKINLWINAISSSKNELALVINLHTSQPLDVSKEIIIVNTLLCDATPTQINNIKYLDKHYQSSYTNPEIKLLPVSKQ